MNKNLQKLDDGILDSVSGGTEIARDLMYRDGVDNAQSGFAIVNNDTQGQPILLGGRNGGTVNPGSYDTVGKLSKPGVPNGYGTVGNGGHTIKREVWT